MSTPPSSISPPDARRPAHPSRGAPPPLPVLLCLLALAAGCAAAPEKAGDVFVAYRSRLETPGGDGSASSGVIVYLVNRSHRRYVRDGQPVLRLLGIKVVSDATMAYCLEELEEAAFFENARPSADLETALVSAPRNQVVVLERDGRVLALTSEPPSASDPGSVEKARHFSRIKWAMIRISQEQTSFQVVPNQKGASYFSEQRRNLLRESRRKRGGR